MLLPMLPPDHMYQMSRAFYEGTGSRRKGRHVSSRDLHQLLDEESALRPDPIWMAFRQAAQRLQQWLTRTPDIEPAHVSDATSTTASSSALAPNPGQGASGC